MTKKELRVAVYAMEDTAAELVYATEVLDRLADKSDDNALYWMIAKVCTLAEKLAEWQLSLQNDLAMEETAAVISNMKATGCSLSEAVAELERGVS